MTTSFLTDRYELTMLQAALRSGAAHRRSVFEVFARRLPEGRRYGVVAGTGRLLEDLADFRFDDHDLAWLEEDDVVDGATLAWLADYEFTGSVWGYAEGECFFPGSPVLVVEGTFAEAVLLETLALSVLNHDCAVAAAASRMTAAAGDRPCLEMGSRRTQEDAAVAAARAAVVAGFAGTSNLEAGRRYGVPTIGTAAHSFTLLHDDERAAFAAQVASLGPGTTLLVDTYDVDQGIRTAVEVAGTDLGGIRLDSGDLPTLARHARELLDSLGATKTRIVVTSDLDRRPDALVHVVGVDEQRRPGAEDVDLRPEGRLLVVVQQREGVRAGPGRGNAVAAAGLEIRGRREAHQVRRPCRGHRGLLVRAARAHLDARPLAGRGHHAGGRRGDRAVVVEDRQRQGLEQHAFGEGRPHGEDR